MASAPYGETGRRGEGDGADLSVLLGFQCVNGDSVLAGEKQAGEIDKILLNTEKGRGFTFILNY